MTDKIRRETLRSLEETEVVAAANLGKAAKQYAYRLCDLTFLKAVALQWATCLKALRDATEAAEKTKGRSS